MSFASLSRISVGERARSGPNAARVSQIPNRVDPISRTFFNPIGDASMTLEMFISFATVLRCPLD